MKKDILRTNVKNHTHCDHCGTDSHSNATCFSQNGKVAVNKGSAKGEKSKNKRKKSKGRKVANKEADSSEEGEYDSDGATSKASSNRISCKPKVRNSVLVKMISIVADTPRIKAKGYVTKSGRKCKRD